MIMFVVPTAVAVANRPSRQPAPFQHVSIWRLVGGEIAHGVNRLRTAVRGSGRWSQRTRRSEAVSAYPSVDEWASRRRLIPARVKS